jgi:hypothetical protein
VISSAVAHTVVLFKSELPNLDMELLPKDYAIDDVGRETIVTSTYDAAQEFVSSYDFASLAETKDNDSPRTL